MCLKLAARVIFNFHIKHLQVGNSRLGAAIAGLYVYYIENPNNCQCPFKNFNNGFFVQPGQCAQKGSMLDGNSQIDRRPLLSYN